MVTERDLAKITHGYDEQNLAIGTIGSHSALDIAVGSHIRGLPNFVIAQRGRERTYTEGFHKRQQGSRAMGCIDEIKVIESWDQLADSETMEWIRERNGIFVPNRSLAVYLRNNETGSYNSLLHMGVPFFGNIHLLQAEERSLPYQLQHNQDFLSEKAGLPVPERFARPRDITRPAIVKASHIGTERSFERNFIIVNSEDEYHTALHQVLEHAPIDQRDHIEEAFLSAPIQEYIGSGEVINLNFFYSQVWDDLELLGTDARTQFPSGEEATHIPISLRESLYEQAFEMGYALVDTVRRYYPRGLVGPFAIQCVGDDHEKLRPIDLSLRIPGSPDSGMTPPSMYLHGRSVAFGERIAIEIQDAVEEGKLHEILS